MEIRVGHYILRSDKFCVWIDEEYKSVDEKTKGKVMTRRVAGYCTSFNRLLEDFMDKAVKESDAKRVEEALAVLDKATKDAKQIAKAAYKGDFKIVRNKEK